MQIASQYGAEVRSLESKKYLRLIFYAKGDISVFQKVYRMYEEKFIGTISLALRQSSFIIFRLRVTFKLKVPNAKVSFTKNWARFGTRSCCQYEYYVHTVVI